MNAQWGLCAVALVVALGAVGLGVHARRRTTRALAASRAEVAALRERLDGLERRVPGERAPRASGSAVPVRPDETEHVITVLGREDPEPAPVPAPLPAPLFADLVLREGVVRTASLAAGVRRALAPEQRHRIRLEMRREVKRARKQRRTDVRAARRALAREQRSGTPRGESAA